MPVRNRVRHLGRAVRAIARDPYEGVERTRERVTETTERRFARWSYFPTTAWEPKLHELVGARWPCGAVAEFGAVWRQAVADLRRRGLAVGRGRFGGWDDADPGLARAAWCLTRHLRPQIVVETGVARGLTSRLVLEALARNGTGRLWSIDLPPLIERQLETETASAVTPELREQWSLLRGSSRRLLPDLVRDVGRVDLFLHDSMHTTRNVRFELAQVWPALRPGGAALVDDVERYPAFGRFSYEHPEAGALVCVADDARALFGCLIRPHA
jgi:hypothetical protein